MRIEHHLCTNQHYSKSAFRPVAFRLPKPGERDPHFGLSRSFYYELEKAGIIQMRRLCKRGNVRGTTLIVFDQVMAYVLGPKSKKTDNPA
jgi:hypothetical protein